MFSFFVFHTVFLIVCYITKYWSLRNDDDDGNENGKKAGGLNRQNNKFARASRYFVHFSAIVARLQRETA